MKQVRAKKIALSLQGSSSDLGGEGGEIVSLLSFYYQNHKWRRYFGLGSSEKKKRRGHTRWLLLTRDLERGAGGLSESMGLLERNREKGDSLALHEKKGERCGVCQS